MSEDRSVLYKIRWEIFIIAASLVLSAVVVLAIPQDFSQKLIEQQKEQREAMQEALKEKELAGFNEGESSAPSTTIP
jgi:flagellar biosynthesis/type III secretory pathway M-ring protein FliF/YscJ